MRSLYRALLALCFHQTSTALALGRLTTLATRLGRQISVGRKASCMGRDGATAFASGVDRKRSILCEASFFVWDAGTALPGNLAPFVDIHSGKSAHCAN